jgi:hypothetical protein
MRLRFPPGLVVQGSKRAVRNCPKPAPGLAFLPMPPDPSAVFTRFRTGRIVGKLNQNFGSVHSLRGCSQMKFSRFPATISVFVVVVGLFTASPTRAQANQIPLAFGATSAAQLSFTMTAASFTAAQWATSMSARALLSSVGMREEHEGLGGNIACSANHVWGMRDDDGGWKHHDDDGGDEDHHATVPEPSTGFLVFSGISALAGWRLRRRAARNTPANLA